MENRYRVILSNNTLYKEIEIPEDKIKFSVGTEIECDFRLRREYFFDKIMLFFEKNDGLWNLRTFDNIYLSEGDVRKLLTVNLDHGDMLEVRYQNTNNLAFRLEFAIDFDAERKYFERAIDVNNAQTVKIGSSNDSDIFIQNKFVTDDRIVLTRSGKSDFKVEVFKSTHGVYIDGKKAKSGEVLKNMSFLSISDYFFYLKNNQIWCEIREDMKINTLSFSDFPESREYPKFYRNSRIRPTVNDEEIEILDPPNKPEKPKDSLMMRLMPSMGMLVAAGVMASYGGRMVIMSAMSATLALATSVMSIRESKKDYKAGIKDRIAKYSTYTDNKRAEISDARAVEAEELEELYPGQKTELANIINFSGELFDRSLNDEDFLHVRLGTGDIDSKREIKYKKQETLEIEDGLNEIPQKLYKEYKLVRNVPVTVDFKEINAIGVIGSRERRFDTLKNMVTDIVSRQYFSDVKMVFIAEKEQREQIKWLRFLPYVYNDMILNRNIATDDESKNIIFEYLFKELSMREQEKEHESRLVIFLYDEYGFKEHPVSKFIDKAKDLGVTFVFFADNRYALPQGADYIIDIQDDSHAILKNAQDSKDTVEFEYPHMSNETAEEIVKLLAPVYTQEVSLEGTLTKNISLFELLNIFNVDDLDLAKRWQESKVHKSMSAPLGVSKGGIVSLDLHDKAHGPHGLVAGTTGSGKSEILQTYILAMSTLFHPHEVSFVIIDFKGGGMVNQFKDLSHLLGAITNIDGKEINRSLKSIKAELQKRQRLFADVDVNHIDKYILKYKSGEAETPLPHLIIIVDEFAELKAEQPEFMKELISAARIGRSLGVHLILATQKPSGQVNEQIWSNSRFKLCLKVQTPEDSNEMLKSPLAAEIKEPGRAYLQVGNNEIFELFQSAYSGASEKVDDSRQKEFTIYSLTDSCRRIPVFVQKNAKSGENAATQLDAIVNYVNKYCREKNLRKLPDICLPSMPHVIKFDEKNIKNVSPVKYPVEIGVYDDPDNQYQGIYDVDLSTSNLIIIGSSQTGKTNILQNLIRNLSMKYTPKEVNIYAIDFASMVLKNFEKLNHVGGVVTPSEDEKLKNLFKLLYGEIEERKEKLMNAGVSSFAAYKEAGGKDLPLIVLMIDNLTALKELYFQDDTELISLCREGLAVGVSLVISNSLTAGIGYKYLSNIATRIALYNNDSNEYGSLFDHCRERIDNIPGRCIIEKDKKHYECQSYLAFEGEKEFERVNDIREFIKKNNENNKEEFARRIPIIPASVTKPFILEEFSNMMNARFNIVTGVDYSTVSPSSINFSQVGVLAVSGRENSGRHNFVKYSLDMLNETNDGKLKVYFIDNVSRKSQELRDKDYVKHYTILSDDVVNYVLEIEAELKSRYESLMQGDDSIIDTSELLVLVIDNNDAINLVTSNPSASAAFKNISGKYKNLNVAIIAFIDNANIPYSAPDILKFVRDNKNIMFFEDLANLKMFDLPLSIMKQFKKAIDLGDGYFIKENTVSKIKTAFLPKTDFSKSEE